MIGIFGGTFDPIHFGHLRTALELKEELGFDQLRLMPSATPPHRQSPLASEQQRLRMVQLAIADESTLQLDEREIVRGGTSYMVDTLASIRGECGDESLVLLLGSDAFAGLTSWDRWSRLFELAHLVVVHRPGWSLQQVDDARLAGAVADRLGHDIDELRREPAGRVLFHRTTPLDISSTAIRGCIQGGRSARYLLPDVVWDFIREQKLYQ